MDQRKRRLMSGLMVVGAITLVFWLKDRLEGNEPIQVLERNHPGMGSEEIALEVWTEQGIFPLDFTLEERKYGDEELGDLFQQGKNWLDQVWLDENISTESVTKDLYFPTEVKDLGIHIRWETESYQWIQTDGTITEEAFLLSPLTTNVRAILSYGETEVSYDYPITIIREELSGDEALKQSIINAVQQSADQGVTLSEVVLPEAINDVELVWYDRADPVCPKIFIFGSVIVVLLYFNQEEKKMRQLKSREIELGRDYPEIVYRLVLLIGTGMTVKGAWEKMLEDYRREKSSTGKIYWGYEEMEMTLREMNYGISELKAYENFGKRCGSQNYIRLSSLLIQQVKRGAKGMNHLLMQEVAEAEIMRKENARKRAEEAGTKLLLPMILIMMVVFAVLMIPAFLSIGI